MRTLSVAGHLTGVGIADVYETSKTLYIVLELVTGGELFDKIVAEGKFSEER